VVTPRRDIDIEVLRNILNAVREGRSIDILYQSMNRSRPDPIWRRITPHAFGYDSFRWHVRAYCHLREGFRDFLLPRILETGDTGAPEKTGDDDDLWNEYFEIKIGAHPNLTESQKLVVGKDYGFTHGKATIR